MDGTAKFVIACWVTVVLVWVISAFSVKRTKKRQPLPARFLYLSALVVVAVLLKGAIRGYLGRVVLSHTLGTGIVADLIVLAGLFISVWARFVLAGNWSARVTLKENHELIQSGPYRVVRHPIYSGILLMILGTAVFTGRLSG